MKKTRLLLALTVWAAIFSSSASAVLIELNFVAEAAGNEQGVEGEVFIFDGIPVTVTSSHAAYLDDLSAGRPAGLGVCSAGLTGSDQCSVPSDDNVTTGEWVTLDFGAYSVISGQFTFNDANHFQLPYSSGDYTYLLGLDIIGADIETLGTQMLFEQALPSGAFNTLTFGYGGDKPAQFYLSGAVDVQVVPLPGIFSLLVAGIGAFGVRRHLQGKPAGNSRIAPPRSGSASSK